VTHLQLISHHRESSVDYGGSCQSVLYLRNLDDCPRVVSRRSGGSGILGKIGISTASQGSPSRIAYSIWIEPEHLHYCYAGIVSQGQV
jgi:hypothetical protein